MLPIYKKDKFEKMGVTKQTIADSISEEDKKDIIRLMKLFRSHRDARGNWAKPAKEMNELYLHFKKYVDPNVTKAIFGCGGCATKIINYMNDLFNLWQSQIK